MKLTDRLIEGFRTLYRHVQSCWAPAVPGEGKPRFSFLEQFRLAWRLEQIRQQARSHAENVRQCLAHQLQQRFDLEAIRMPAYRQVRVFRKLVAARWLEDEVIICLWNDFKEKLEASLIESNTEENKQVERWTRAREEAFQQEFRQLFREACRERPRVGKRLWQDSLLARHHNYLLGEALQECSLPWTRHELAQDFLDWDNVELATKGLQIAYRAGYLNQALDLARPHEHQYGPVGLKRGLWRWLQREEMLDKNTTGLAERHTRALCQHENPRLRKLGVRLAGRSQPEDSKGFETEERTPARRRSV